MKELRSFYREEAQRKLTGKYGEVILYLILTGIVAGIFTSLTDSFRPDYQDGIMIDQGIPALVTLFSVLGFLFSAGIAYSTQSLFIDITNDEQFNVWEKIKIGFVNDYGRNIVLVFMQGLFTFLWALLLIVPGIIKAYAYSMSMYIVNKEPQVQGIEAITRSKTIMSGHKMDLFLLDLSYIGWYLLSILTLGILLLWVVPRHSTARTLVFNEIYYDGVEPVKVEKQEEDDIFGDSLI